MVRLIDFVLEDARYSYFFIYAVYVKLCALFFFIICFFFSSENQLHCTVWDAHVDLLPHFNSTSVEPVVLLLQLCRPRFLDNK